jgi:hypothetical protein
VPILVDAELRVIAGHGRLLACSLLGHSEVPTISLEHLSPAQARAFMIADNRLTEIAGKLLAGHSHDGSLHFICMDWRHMTELLAAGKEAYAELKNLCVWTKDNAGMGSLYRSQHELVFVFKHGREPHRNNIQLGRYGRNRSNVWNYPGVNSRSAAAAPKAISWPYTRR